jgi:putative ribosome biogenesis GTPase RsgA
VIDTPGTREFHMWVAEDGIQEAFLKLKSWPRCRFETAATLLKATALKEALEVGRLRSNAEAYSQALNEIERLASHKRNEGSWKRNVRQMAQRAF